MDQLYYDFVNQMKDGLHKEINGMIRYEVYPSIDTVIFKVRFKDFEYNYALNHISHNIYDGVTIEDHIMEFKRQYLKAIKNAFFKSEERKKREEAITYNE